MIEKTTSSLLAAKLEGEQHLPVQSGIDAHLQEALNYARQAYSPATLRAYEHDWAQFELWCVSHDTSALPAKPQTVAAYLASLAHQHARSSLHRIVAAIQAHHRLRNQPFDSRHPAIMTTLRGINRSHDRRTIQSSALTSKEIKKLLGSSDDSLRFCRNKAIILLGFTGALRRSEIVSIDFEHLNFDASGLRLFIPRSKTDQQQEGVSIGIPKAKNSDFCPVKAMETWLRRSNCQYGPVFRKINRWNKIETSRLTDESIRLILIDLCQKAGLKAVPGERLSPHGLRAGFITEAYLAGARDEEIMPHTRHKSVTTMRRYVRKAKLIVDSPARKLDL